MTASKPGQTRRKTAKRPPSYYKNLVKSLQQRVGQLRSLPTTPRKAKHHYSRSGAALAEDFKTFLQWTLDRYPRVRASESLNNYWRVLNMHILDQSGCELDDSIRRDVTNYKKVLVDEYKLRRLPKKRGVSRVDDLYHILFYHWVHDEVVYRDEQQRNYVSTGILMASYFGCRPVSMFDTRLRFEDDDGARKSVDHVTAAGKPNNVGEDQEVQGSENDMDANDDASTYCDSDSDSGTDDGVDAGLDETGCLL
ncbi:MAG: hypothetical protein L6R38_000538 [Xanthoria sp. 2 TBL-2021]|nr:MAG: hypothetical protein L6R38_000538 [Xanthoria sp. 2 TBL-2021]